MAHCTIPKNSSLTPSQQKALEILRGTSFSNAMTMRRFAEAMWPQSIMHTSVKNTGNGATSGKAAWLVAGSYLAKLQKLGLVRKTIDSATMVYLTNEGRKRLETTSH